MVLRLRVRDCFVVVIGTIPTIVTSKKIANSKLEFVVGVRIRPFFKYKRIKYLVQGFFKIEITSRRL
jgi:hypothetical protein